VDSGVIPIGDPCRLVDLEYGEMSPGNDLYKQIEQPEHGQPGDDMIPGAVNRQVSPDEPEGLDYQHQTYDFFHHLRRGRIT
jgi:hypothetical protein